MRNRSLRDVATALPRDEVDNDDADDDDDDDDDMVVVVVVAMVGVEDEAGECDCDREGWACGRSFMCVRAGDESINANSAIGSICAFRGAKTIVNQAYVRVCNWGGQDQQVPFSR